MRFGKEMGQFALCTGVCAAMCAALLGSAVFAQEAAEDSGDEYRPPAGFGAYVWKTPLSRFQRLAPEPVYVRIAHSDGQTTEFDMDCFNAGGALSQCTEVEGIGYHALAEYYVDSQGFRISDKVRDTKTVLFPITYQFCANWGGFSNKLQGDALEKLQLCGVRLHFRSETAVEEQAITDYEYVTSAKRVLNWLLANYGEPEGFVRKGNVIIGIPEFMPQNAARKSRHDNWHWCGPKADEVAPSCAASIVYTFDSETGRGQVIMLTPEVWLYAHARRYGGTEDDPLYRVLHGNVQQAAVKHVCTGTFLCAPPPPKPMSDEIMNRFRLPAASAPAMKQ